MPLVCITIIPLNHYWGPPYSQARFTLGFLKKISANPSPLSASNDKPLPSSMPSDRYISIRLNRLVLTFQLSHPFQPHIAHSFTAKLNHRCLHTLSNIMRQNYDRHSADSNSIEIIAAKGAINNHILIHFVIIDCDYWKTEAIHQNILRESHVLVGYIVGVIMFAFTFSIGH